VSYILQESEPKIIEEIEDGAVIGDDDAMYLELGRTYITLAPAHAREIAVALLKVADAIDPDDDGSDAGEETDTSQAAQ